MAVWAEPIVGGRMKNKKLIMALTLAIMAGVLSFTYQAGESNAKDVYSFGESYLSSGKETREQEEYLAEVGDIHEAELAVNQWGYTYSAGGNDNSIIETKTDSETLNSEPGNPGEKKEISEKILSWDEAQEHFGYDALRWLNNGYLFSCAGDVSFIVSDDDVDIAEYSIQTSKVKIYTFTVCGENDKCFEFGRNYSSELYNVYQVEEDYTWQCFSYKGYDGTEYTSAVLPCGNIVCEIVFEECDKQFIYNALASYE